MNIRSSNQKGIVILVLFCVMLIFGIILLYFSYYIGNSGRKPGDESIFVKINSEDSIVLKPITVNNDTMTFRQMNFNSNEYNSLIKQIAPYQISFTYHKNNDDFSVLNIPESQQESAVRDYQYMIELYGDPIKKVIDYFSLHSDLTFSTMIDNSYNMTNDVMSYQINGTILYNNTINLYLFKNSMEECQNSYLKDMKKNEIIFLHEMREYKASTKEERFHYFVKEIYDDNTFLYEFISNYTILNDSHSVLNINTISQQEARINFCNIIADIKKLITNN